MSLYQRTVESIMQGLETKTLEGQRPVIVATPSDTLERAQTWFIRHRVHHLPVVRSIEDPTLLGMVSTVDILSYYAGHAHRDASQVQLSEVMVKDPDTLAPHTRIDAALQMFADAPYQSFPVVDANRHCVGIVTVKDMVRAVAEAVKAGSSI